MNVIREINRINDRELELGLSGASWHDEYKDSAYVFCGGLPFDLTEGDVVTIFSQFGEIVDVNMPRDKETHKPRGFAFVMYEDQRSTVLAVDNLNGGTVLGRTIRVDHVKDYKQPGGKKEDGQFVPPEEPSMNAMPALLNDSDGSSDSSDAESGGDAEDPMAAYIRAERRKQKAITGGSERSKKKRRHDGETKDERRARKAAKRAKKEAKRAGRGGRDEKARKDGGKDVKREVKSERDRSPEGRRGGYEDLAKQFGQGQRDRRGEDGSATPPRGSARGDRSPIRRVKREDEHEVRGEASHSGGREDGRNRYGDEARSRDRDDRRERSGRDERGGRDERYSGGREDCERGGRSAYERADGRSGRRDDDWRDDRYARR